MDSPRFPQHRNRLVSVDVLRALAALAVVVSHVPFSAADLPGPVAALLSAAVHFGRVGVVLFLVLSGFCIHLGVARGIAGGRGVRADWGGFWKRRFWRLYPPYLAAVAFSLAVYAAVGPGDALIGRVPDLPWDLLTHLLLIHNLFADYCFGLGNGPFWTLGLEEQLYALYAPFLALRRRRAVTWVLGLVLLLSLAWQCGWHGWVGTDDGALHPTLGPAPLALGRWLKWPFGFWFAWALGAVAAEAYTGALRLPGWCSRSWTAGLMVVTGLATNHTGLTLLFGRGRGGLGDFFGWPGGIDPHLVLGVLSGLSDLAFAGAAFVILNRWVRREVGGGFRGRCARALAGIGVMSYSLYLTHVPLQRLLVGWLPDGSSCACWLVRLAVLVPACLGFAALFFWGVERHFLVRVRESLVGVRGERGASVPRLPVTGGLRSPLVDARSQRPRARRNGGIPKDCSA